MSEIENAAKVMQRISELCCCADSDAHKVLWPISALDVLEADRAAIRARAIEECVVGAEEKTERMLDSATEHREKGMAPVAERIEYAAGYVADLSIELRALLATDGQPVWLRPNCDVCRGMGIAVETRVVGDEMVCEAGHRWISPVKNAHPEPDPNVVARPAMFRPLGAKGDRSTET